MTISFFTARGGRDRTIICAGYKNPNLFMGTGFHMTTESALIRASSLRQFREGIHCQD